ncbi:hypothetical protein MPNTM1_05508 [Mycolicibacterium parafortuitum]|uniref:hypothetical protein n=1 Tax=Mycolicibacterium parafortuitum TaxID=39692 RepID=UPI0032C48AE4
MNAIATKFKVGAAAVAVAGAATLAPIAANAAPAVQLPAAPVMSDLAQQPQGLFGVFVVQFTGAVTRTSTYWTRLTILNYNSLLEANPDSVFAPFWEARVERLNQQLARYGEVELSSCFGGRSYSIVAGSYGGVTTGNCAS